MNQKTFKYIKFLLSAILAAVLVYFAFKSVDWNSFWSGLKETRWLYVLLFLAASIMALVLRSGRWRQLMLPLDSEVSLLRTWDANNVGNMANVALPGSGEFIRCGIVSSRQSGYDKTLGTIVMERIWDILAIAVLFVLALALKWDKLGNFFIDNIWNPLAARLDFSLWWIVAAAFAAMAAAICFVMTFRNRFKLCAKIVSVVKGIFSGFGSFFAMEHKFRFALYTAGIWTMYVLMSWFGLMALPSLSGMGFVDALFISAIGNIASVIPVPGGIGAYHYLIALTISSIYGAEWDMGILYATLCHEFHAVLILVLGALSYLKLSVSGRNQRTDCEA